MPKVPKTLLDKIIVDKALDRASRLRNQMLERGMTLSEVRRLEEELIESLNPIVKRWKPVMRRGPLGAKDILTTGKFKNQFETGTSAGAYSPGLRHEISDRYFAEMEDDAAREKYGYLRRPKKYGRDNVGGYGDYEFRFKPAVRERMTFNNGDTLDDFYLEDAPTPIIPGMEDTYINFIGRPEPNHLTSWWPSEIQLYKRRLADLKKESGPSPRHSQYFETQYHGPLTLDDVEKVAVPNSLFTKVEGKYELLPGTEYADLVRQRADEYGFKVLDEDGKCIYNCR